MRSENVPFVAVGALTGSIPLVSMLRTHPTARIGSYLLASPVGPSTRPWSWNCSSSPPAASVLASGFRHTFWFGISSLVAIVVPARLPVDGLTSL